MAAVMASAAESSALTATRIDPSQLSAYATPTVLRTHRKPLARIKTGAHPSLPLRIHNYTESILFRHLWDPLTLAARSLVTHAGTGEVVARAFPKFFNHHEKWAYAPTGAEFLAVAEEKLDGSIILRFWFQGAWRWASKGSFDSQHVLMAEEVWAERAYDERLRECGAAELDRTRTYVFELIHPANVIGVRYGARKELVLLGVFRANGEEPPPDFDYQAELPVFSRPRTLVLERGAVDYEGLKKMECANAEGFVVKFFRAPDDARPARVKVKFEAYLELVRGKVAISPAGITERFVSERLGIGIFDPGEAEPRLAAARHKYRAFVTGLADDFGGEEWIATVMGFWNRAREAFREPEREFAAAVRELKAEGFRVGTSQPEQDRRRFAKRVVGEAVPAGFRKALFAWFTGQGEKRALELLLASVVLPAELRDGKTLGDRLFRQQRWKEGMAKHSDQVRGG